MCIAAIFCWIIPESPVYLLELNRFEEAKEVMLKMARFNRSESEFRVACDNAHMAMERHK